MPIGAFRLNTLAKKIASIIFNGPKFIGASQYAHTGLFTSGGTGVNYTNKMSDFVIPGFKNYEQSGRKVAVAVQANNDRYLAVILSATPFVALFRQVNSTGAWTSITIPTASYAAAPNDLAFNPAGTTLAFVGGFVSPSPYYTKLFNISGSTATHIADAVSDIPGTARCVAWNHDGSSIAVGFNSSPFFTVHNRSGDTFTKIANPGTLPLYGANGITFNHNGSSIAVAQNNGGTQPLSIYNRSGDTLTKVADPGTFPTGISWGVAFNHDNTSLAVAHATSPYVTIYNRSGDTFTKITNPSTLPSGTSNSVKWNSDGTSLAVAGAFSASVGPFMIYNRSGDTFTKIANPSILMAQNLSSGLGYNNVQWISGGIITNVSQYPQLQSYSRSGDTLSISFPTQNFSDVGLVNPSTDFKFNSAGTSLATGTNNASAAYVYNLDAAGTPTLAASISPNIGTTISSVAWTPDGDYLSLGGISSPYLRLYSRSGDTFTQYTPATNPGFLPNCQQWNHDGSSVAMGSESSPYIHIYNRSGTTLTKLSNPAALPAGHAWAVSWNHNNTSLAVAHNSDPRVTIYNRSGDTFTKITSPWADNAPTGNTLALAFSNNGNYLAIQQFGNIAVYSRTGDSFSRVAVVVSGYGTTNIASLKWSPDDTQIMTYGIPTSVTTVYPYKIWAFSGTALVDKSAVFDGGASAPFSTTGSKGDAYWAPVV